MSRIASTLSQLKAQGRKALIPYVTAGFPFADVTPELMHAMVAAGADVIELGVPFSDPMADGPAIQAAGLRALDYTPVVRAGGPTSAVFRWADSFFPRYAAKLRDGGWISADEWEEFVTDWSARRVDASSLFWSPAVVTAVAVKDA